MPSRDDYCPVAKSVEILGDRWCLLLVREMLRGVRRFNELERSLPGISRSILAQRLRHLEREGIVRREVGDGGRSSEYLLTAAGHELGGVVGALNDWGTRWLLPESRASEVDPDGLMVWVSRHVVLHELPERRVVVGFDVQAKDRRRYWLVLQTDQVSLCPEHPGFDEDVRVTSDAATLYGVFAGRESLARAVEAGTVRVDGPPSLARALAVWFRLGGAPGAAKSEAQPVVRLTSG